MPKLSGPILSVIVTLPAVVVEGEGLDARIAVGNRTVGFDGTKVVFD